MPQNRPDLIKRFIGIASNAITHKIIIKTELAEEIRQHYLKEIERDVDVALSYRDKINPTNSLLPLKDAEEIKSKILLKVKSELCKRKDKGYNIDFSLVDKEVDIFLKENKVS